MDFPQSPLEDWTGALLPEDRQLWIKRDDLLPFLLAGNKYRKLSYELDAQLDHGTVVITVGSIHSNHCRTTALLCARRHLECYLILHDEVPGSAIAEYGKRILDRLGASYLVVQPQAIHDAIVGVLAGFQDEGRKVVFVEGGCHTPSGVMAYRDAVLELSKQLLEEPAYLFLASGTGATQAGLALGCQQLGWDTQVVGISVARPQTSGLGAVNEAISWFSDPIYVNTVFVDDYRAGGYGLADSRTIDAVDHAWRMGLPLDPVYTGKAMAGMIDMQRRGLLERPGSTVFWHTGGLFQGLLSD